MGKVEKTDKILKKDKIFFENEVNANRMMAQILNVTFVIVAITWALFENDVFYSRVPVRGLMIFNLALISFSNFICRHFKYERSWIKYSLMGTLTAVYAGSTSVLTYNVTLLVVIPIILSIRYFSKRYTMSIAVLSILIFFAAYLYGANHGMLDLNFVQYSPGTVITTNENMWLDDAVKDIPYDKNLMLINTMFSNYFVKFLQLVIIAVAAVKLVGHCQEIMSKQKKLTETSARIGTELALAEKIQADMLPNLFPAFPERAEFDLYASMNPAKEVGGDFYDFFMIDDDHLGLVIADVSGKGIPAAMFMMFSKNIIANNTMLGKSPAKALMDANEAICANNSEEMFVTVWLGILELSTGKMTCTNAGHEYPMIRGTDGQFRLFEDRHGLVVGAMKRSKYKDYELQLHPGDAVFVYTDGVPEANNAEGEFYGEERLEAALNRVAAEGPKEILSGVKADIDTFVAEAHQFDDLTMLCVAYKGVNL